MKKIICAMLCIFISITLSGCWSRKEPKILALVNSAIYDLSDTGGYKVTIEVINPSAQGGVQDGGSGKSPNITATGKGSSIPEAIRNVSESIDKVIFGGHNKVRFFSERFARKDMTVVMDYLLRDHLTDERPLMVVIRADDPKRVYSCMIGLSETVGDYLESIAKTQPDITSQSVFVTTLDFIKDYYEDGKQPVAGVIELVECDSKPSNNTVVDANNAQGSQNSPDGSDKQYRIVYKGLAAFQDNKLVGYMDEIEARAYNFITDNIQRAVISIPSENDQTVVVVNRSKAAIKTEIKKDRVIVDVQIKISMSIIQENGILDISKAEALKTVEADFNKQMAEEIIAAVQKAQAEFQSDIFGFGVAMHKQHPEKWKEIKEDWDDYFAKAAINVSVESTVNRSGEIKQPFRLEVK